jgi:hypothetical protein
MQNLNGFTDQPNLEESKVSTNSIGIKIIHSKGSSHYFKKQL